MKRLAIATLVVSIANVAYADTPAAAEPDTCTTDKTRPGPRCDEIADVESQEANLESKEQRKGFAFSVAIGGGIMMGGDIGVGRGPSLSLRLGHVATRKTNITFELTRGEGYHKASIDGPTLSDSDTAFFVGAQRFAKRAFWVRAAGGLTAFVEDAMKDGTGGAAPILGVGGLLGAGADIFRLGRFLPVIGVEAFGMASISRDGFKLHGAFGLGFSYY
ncbi:MAG TPA: hypothetical protein VIV11_33140 [Kofleriaceae bacterium]